MLTLTRRVGEKILIGGGIEIEVVKIGTWRVQLRINAPSETKILRQELIPAQCPEIFWQELIPDQCPEILRAAQEPLIPTQCPEPEN